MIKAIFFDFDGVIAESVDVKTKAFAKLFEGYGQEVEQKVVAHHLAHGGVSRFEKIRYYHENYVGKSLGEGELDIWCNRFSGLVLDAVIGAPFVTGAIELLDECYQKYSCFIISGTPQEEMELIIARKGLEKYFIEIHGSPKKKPDIAGDILRSHNLTPQEIIYIGDATTDYEASKAMGIPFIGRVPEGFQNQFPPDVPTGKDLMVIGALMRDMIEQQS